MTTVYLGLGSNSGARQEMLNTALEQLELAGVRVTKRSSVYETEPMYVLEQPWFLNMAVEVETGMDPAGLLLCLQGIERTLGRKEKGNKGPRTIDIDILFFGGLVVQSPELTVPHPLLQERLFVLEPLLEIAPELRHPLTGKSVREMLATPGD